MKFRDVKEMPGTGSGDKSFVRLKDGESIVGVLRGEIEEYFCIWPQGGQKKIVPEGTPGAKFRFKVNFLVQDGANWVPKILDMGITLYKQFADLASEWDVEKTFIKITRNGDDSKNTKYTAIPSPKPVSPEVLNLFSTIKLLDLSEGKKNKSSSDGESVPSWVSEEVPDDDEIPF